MVVAMFMHVMLAVLHAVDDRAGRHEEQRLEEGVGDEMEGGGDIRADAQGRHHETQLRNRRVSQHGFDVILRQRHGRRQQSREGADHRHKCQRLGHDAMMRIAAGGK